MHTGKCLHMQTAAVSLKWPMSHRYPAMSRFVFLSVSNFMRQWCVTAVTRTRKVPRCPGIHSALLTRLLDFAFVPPISLSAKLSEMRFLSSVEFFFSDEKTPGLGWGRWGQQHHLQFPSVWLRNGWLILIMALHSKHDRLSSETIFTESHALLAALSHTFEH